LGGCTYIKIRGVRALKGGVHLSVPIRKGRIVVNIRGLNKITYTDAYPIPL